MRMMIPRMLFLNEHHGGARCTQAVRYLCAVQPEAAQPQDFSVVGHSFDPPSS